MELPGLASLDGLATIGLRGRVDLRPTLLRVLTDLYVQKLQHTADEERHYTELALRLLDSVDVPTRAAVAARLGRHLSPPRRVIEHLLKDLPEVVAALAPQRVVQSAASVAMAATPIKQPAPTAEASARRAQASPDDLDPAMASDLNEQFFAANEHERRLILLNFHIVVPVGTGHVVIARDPAVGPRLEAAALSHNREEFAKHLAKALQVPHDQARRIAADNLGEPITVAIKALGIARELVYRILMFANPAVGHSIERVHALAALYDEMTLPAAEGMIAIWQALDNKRSMAKHQPLFWHDEHSPARAAVATPRQPHAPVLPSQRRVAL